MSEEYLCKDCKHSFTALGSWAFYLFDLNSKYRFTCRKSFKPEHTEPNLVTGSSVEKGTYQNCSAFRIGKSEEGNCGRDGYYWEPNSPKGLFKKIIKESV